MESSGQSAPSVRDPRGSSGQSRAGARSASFRPLLPRDIQLYRVCEDLTEGLIYGMVVFSPWAFGTTQPWAIWSMNIAGYLLGAMLLIKLALHWLKGYRPPRWDSRPALPIAEQTDSTLPSVSRLTPFLAVVTVLVLLYCLVSAMNSRATYLPQELRFDYHHRPAWCFNLLPSSLNSSATWRAFWNYLALAFSFWAVRDWLLGMSDAEQRGAHPLAPRWSNQLASRKPREGGSHTKAEPSLVAPQSDERGTLDTRPSTLSASAQPLPARVRRLLWVLAINGGLLALESILQRAAGSTRLLFLIQPRVNPTGETQFGPYAYRANASAYFNLVWPIGLAFWWTLHRVSGRKTHHILLFLCILMAACPIISTSRGGAMITVGILVLALMLLAAAQLVFPQDQDSRRRGGMALRLVALGGLAAVLLGLSLGWENLKPRLAELQGSFAGREQMYEAARPMAHDYPLFGTGPGTFDSIFQLYRVSTETYWPAQLHNDWLETRITFGWVGSTLVAFAFLAVVLRWFARGGIHGGRRFMMLTWLALIGCLIHARYDFPFQIYSILFLFLVLCSLLFTLTRRSGA